MSLPADSIADQDVSPSPTTWDLFTGFLFLGLIGFGGVLPLTRRMVVDQRHWLDDSEFVDLLGLCQFLPGGNVVNMSVAIGLKFRGVIGAVAAISGLLAAPSAIVIALGVLYDHLHDDPKISHLFAGLAAAASGLLISMAVKIALPLRGRRVGIAVAVVCFVGIAILRLPLLPTMLVLVPISIVATWKIGP